MFEDIRDPDERMRAVTAYASQVTIDKSIPAKRYFRSGKEMLRMANVYCDEKNYEGAYILYAKFITLFVERVPKHPDYKSVPVGFVKENKQKLNDVFPVAELLKKKLKTRYTEQELIRRELEKKDAAALAKKQELERIEEEKRKKEEERKRKEEEEKANDMMAIYGEQMIKEQEVQFRLLQEEERKRLQKESASAQPQNEAVTPLPPPSAPSDELPGSFPAADIAALNINQQVPAVPPPAYGSLSPQTADRPVIPSRDLKPADARAQAPAVDRSTKPPDHFMSTGATTGNRFNLKDVWVPAELMVKFLNLALPNTNRGVETGGFLFGKFAQGQFKITHLILPEQMGKPDSFIDQSDEDELFTIQDKYDVTQLGWIHTHPTQTAFLSSVDQHVQASFQCMLPESIAIVCSPKFQETGIFYLTPDYGLDYVVNCDGKGFHPHPSSPALFETCSHAKVDNSGKITVVDLRKR